MNPNEDPETLERRSDTIRANVGETLDALQRNYSPGALVDRSMDLLRDHGGEMATNILQTVRRNPMPVLLVAAGVTWLVASQLRSGRQDDEYSTGIDDPNSRYGGASGVYDEDDLSLDTGYTYGGSSTDASMAEGTTYTTGSYDVGDDDALGGESTPGGGAAGRLASAREKLRNATHAASDTVTGGARKLSERARQVAQSARQRTRSAGPGMTRLLQDQPFAVGAAGIAIGALIGALLPETAQEDRLLGPARDRALNKARSAGEQGFETARQKVHEAVDRTRDSLRDGGREEGGGATVISGTGPVA